MEASVASVPYQIKTVYSRPGMALRWAIWLLLLGYALLEFYPVNYFVNTVVFLFVNAMALVLVLSFPGIKVITRHNYEPLIYMLAWLAYSLLGYIWAQDRMLALDFSFLIYRYLIAFLVFDALCRDNRVLERSHLILLGFLGLYLLTAYWEMATFSHLPSSKLYGIKHFTPTGPFYNQNNLAAFMLLLLPFALFLPKLHAGKLTKTLSAIMVASVMIIITVQGARIAMLAAGGVIGLAFLFFSSIRTKLLSLLIVLVLGVAITRFFPVPVRIVSGIARKEIRSFGEEAETVQMSSIKIRMQLFRESFDLTAGSAFMGLGGGNFEHYMDTDREYRTAGIINAHNWLLEIMSNYGVIILLGFLYLYLRWLYILYCRVRNSQGRLHYFYLMYFYSLILFLPACALPSSIRWNHMIWIYFAVVNAVCHQTPKLLRDSNA